MAIQQPERSVIARACTQRTHTRSPWVGSINKNGAIEIRDRQGDLVVTIHAAGIAGVGPRELDLANLILAAPHFADFAEEFLAAFAGDIQVAISRMQEQPDQLGQLQLLASLGIARMHGTAGVTP